MWLRQAGVVQLGGGWWGHGAELLCTVTAFAAFSPRSRRADSLAPLTPRCKLQVTPQQLTTKSFIPSAPTNNPPDCGCCHRASQRLRLLRFAPSRHKAGRRCNCSCWAYLTPPAPLNPPCFVDEVNDRLLSAPCHGNRLSWKV